MSLLSGKKPLCLGMVVFGLFAMIVLSNRVYSETQVYDLTKATGHSVECLAFLHGARREAGILPIMVDYLREHDLSETPDYVNLLFLLPTSRYDWATRETASILDVGKVKYRFLTRYPQQFGDYEPYLLEGFNDLLNDLQTQITNRTFPVEEIGRRHQVGSFGRIYLHFYWSWVKRTEKLKVLVRAESFQHNYGIKRVLIAYRFQQGDELVTRYLLTDGDGRAEGPLPQGVKEITFDILGVPNFISR